MEGIDSGEMFTSKFGDERGELEKSLFPGSEVMDGTCSGQIGGKGTLDRGNNGTNHKSENPWAIFARWPTCGWETLFMRRCGAPVCSQAGYCHYPR